MKKIVILTVLSLFLAGITAYGQGFFNHMSLGIGAGTDGPTLQIAMPIGNHFSIRAAGSYLPLINVYTKEINSSDFPQKIKDAYNMEEGQSVGLNLGIKTLEGKMLFDYYPSKYKSFHITAGVHVGNSDIFNLTTTSLPMDPSNYAKDFVMIDGHRVGTDANGKLHAGIATAKVKPYIGIGWGRAIPKNRVNCFFDFGSIFWGHPTPSAVDLDGKTVKMPAEVVKNDLGVEEDSAIYKGVKIGGKVIAAPILRLGINVKLF